MRRPIVAGGSRPRRPRVAGIASIVGAVVVLVASIAPVASGAWPRGGRGPVPASGSLPTVLTHVVVVVEENHDLAWTLTDSTFDSLYTKNAHATKAFAVCHPSASNYLAATDALVQQCGSDTVTSYSSTNLGYDLASHKLSWQGLMESMPSACDRSDSYPYLAHHNPWIYYSDLNSTCSKNDIPFFESGGTSELAEELRAGTLPSLTFVTPNRLHDAHDGTLAAASSWLTSDVISPIEASSLYAKNTVMFVVFDEAYSKSCDCPEAGGFTAGGVTVDGGPIYLVAISPIPPVKLAFTSDVTFFNLVSTIEWLLAVPSLGHDDSSHFPPMTGLFK